MKAASYPRQLFLSLSLTLSSLSPSPPLAGQSVMPTAGGYCASKAAVTQLAKAIALEEAPHGVRANVVSPGVILTDLVRKFFQEQSGQKMR